MGRPYPSYFVETGCRQPVLVELDDRQRRELHEALLDADNFEDLPGSWQPEILEAEAGRPQLRPVDGDRPRARPGIDTLPETVARMSSVVALTLTPIALPAFCVRLPPRRTPGGVTSAGGHYRTHGSHGLGGEHFAEHFRDHGLALAVGMNAVAAHECLAAELEGRVDVGDQGSARPEMQTMRSLSPSRGSPLLH